MLGTFLNQFILLIEILKSAWLIGIGPINPNARLNAFLQKIVYSMKVDLMTI
jgi:hypothetical protein